MVIVYKLIRLHDNIVTFIEENKFVCKRDAQDFIIRATMNWIILFQCPPTEKFCRLFCFGNNRQYFPYISYYISPICLDYIRNELHIRGLLLQITHPTK